MSLDVSKWQNFRPGFAYTPVMQFWKRLIETAMIDAEDVRDGMPTDRALLARAWFARPTPDPLLEPEDYATCFSFACHVLNLNEEAERVAFLAMIDTLGDYDTDECWERLEKLLSQPLEEEPEEVFESFRVVPELDQIRMFV
jgi:hypothetical protein